MTRAGPGEYSGDFSGYRYLQLRLEDVAGIERVAGALPRLDVLVNNAGGNFAAQDEYEPEIFERSVRVNLLGAYRMAHACRPKLAASRLPAGASIVGIASMTLSTTSTRMQKYRFFIKLIDPPPGLASALTTAKSALRDIGPPK